MLGWNLYLQIALSTGSERLPESLFIIYVFSFIFKFKTALKNYLIRQQFLDHLVITHYLQQVVYSNHGLLYLRKKT